MNRYKTQRPQNRSAILECIFRNAPVSRTEIAEMTGITPATVTANVTELISSNIVLETGELTNEPGSSGRKRVLIDLNPVCALTAGVEFTENAVVFCLSDLMGNLLDSLIVPFSQDIAANITQEIITHLHDFLAPFMERDHQQIAGIGVAVPGHMSEDGTQLISNNKLWQSFQPALIRQAFPFPVAVENNVHCMTLGHYLFHASANTANFIYYHVGRGMFCSYMINGRIYYGSNYTLGEIGHTIIEPDGQLCECGKHGCLQTYSSESWLLKNARLLYGASQGTYLRSLAGSDRELTIDHVLTAYSMGDPVVRSYITNAVKYLGISISNLSIIFGMDKIYLHGALFQDEHVRMELKDYISRQLSFLDGSYSEHIETLGWDPRDGATGACALAIFEFFIREHPFSSI